MSRTEGARSRLMDLVLGGVLAASASPLAAQTALQPASPAPAAQSAQTLSEEEQAAARALLLEPILLDAQRPAPQGDAVYFTPAPVSAISEEEIQSRFAGDAQSALRATPGVFTRQQSNQPGIEVNIRGMSGYGRVNAMIDGVPQTFRNISSHEASGGSMLYAHPELVGGIDVTRGAVSGAHGAGTLTGAANFRTLEIDDVLRPGRDSGGLARLKFGGNGYDRSGMAAYAHRVRGILGGEGELGGVVALAYTEQSDYKNGQGLVVPGRGSANSPRSGLAKLEFSPNADHKFDLGFRRYENGFVNSGYNWDMTNQTWTAGWRYAPENPWVNLNLDLYRNDTELAYEGAGGSFAGRRTEDVTTGIGLTNRATFALAGQDLTLDAGASWQRHDFKTLYARGGNHPGQLDKASLFAEASTDFGPLGVSAGLRYDYWRLNGWRAPYNAGWADCPAGGPACGGDWVSRDGGEILPKIGLTFDAADSAQLYATYAHTARPPTSHEAFFALVPFGNGVGSGAANNPNLKPETSRGWDLGVNLHQDGLLLEGDRARLKLGYFHNTIEDFIVNDFVQVAGRGSTAMWVNRPGETKMHGIEVEGGYDAGFAYVNLGYSRSDTDDQPWGQGAGGGNGEGSVQPESVFTADAGVRLFDGRLNLGAQYRHVGNGKEVQFFTGFQETPSYGLIDLYGSYDVTDDAQVFFTVENLEDKAYGYAGSGLGGSRSLSGRGRTFIAGLNAKF